MTNTKQVVPASVGIRHQCSAPEEVYSEPSQTPSLHEQSSKARAVKGGGSFFDVAEKSNQSERVRRASIQAQREAIKSSIHYTGTKQKKWWVIDPRQSSAVNYWDGVTMLAMIFTALVTPFEVGFVDSPPLDERGGNPLFWINRVVDIIFVLDMLLQFCLGYAVAAGGGKYWEFGARAIAWNYISSPWFYLDSFSIAVSAFDIFGGDGEASSLSALRAVRTLRLIKLVRLTRGSRVFKRWEMRISINYTYLSLGTTCATILLSCHWFACIWGLQATFNRLGSWLYVSDYCVEWGAFDRGPVNRSEIESMMSTCPAGKRCFAGGTCGCFAGGTCTSGCACEQPGTVYVYALYWSVMTITSVGYGDVSATEFNVGEQVVCTVMMLFGGMLWGYLIGTFCGIAAQLSPDVRAFREHLSGLNAFMATHRLPSLMRIKLREYMHQSVHLVSARRDHGVLQYLSRQMQLEVAWYVHRQWLERVWYLSSEDQSTRAVLLDLASRLSAGVYPPGELCVPGRMYIVSRGIALRGARVFRTGTVWGEDILLAHHHLQKNWPALAMSYLWVFSLDSDTLLGVLQHHPEASRPIWVVRQRWLVCRGIVKLAELQLEEERRGSQKERGLLGALKLLDGERLARTAEARQRGPGPQLAGPPAAVKNDVAALAPGAPGHELEPPATSELKQEVAKLREEMRARDDAMAMQLRQLSAAVEQLSARGMTVTTIE